MSKRFTFVCLVGGLVVSLLLNGHLYNKVKRGTIYTDTLTLTFWDSVPFPVPRDSIVIRYVTATFPVAPDTNVANKIERPFSCCHENDSAEVVVPITQNIYDTPDYRAYVSGYAPRLDSLFFRRQREVVTVRLKPHRWGLGLQAGYSIPHGGYIGVGVSYNLWTW